MIASSSVRASSTEQSPFGQRHRNSGMRFPLLAATQGKILQPDGVPHFHAVYGEHEISVEIETATVHGDFPARALKLVLEWANLHKPELLENWQLARQAQPLKRIAPLE